MRRLRIARTRADAARPIQIGALAAHQSAARISEFLRTHGAPGLDGFLAQPEPSADGSEIDWYTAHPGTAVALTNLVGNDRVALEERLAVRLAQLRELAKTAPTDIAPLLLAAAHYPGPGHVFAVGREPVLAMWGHDDPTTAAAVPPAATPTPVVPAPSRRWWWLALAALALIAALLLLSYCWRPEEPIVVPPAAEIAVPPVPALDPDLVKKLEAERQRAEDLRKQLDALAAEFADKLKACTAADPVPPAPLPAIEPPPVPKVVPAPEPAPPPKKVEKPKKEPVKTPPPAPEKKAEAPAPIVVPPPATPIPAVTTKAQCEQLVPPRKKWEAPEVVFVVDGSGSMKENVGGQSRLDAAKDSVGYIADHLPADIDTALVKFTDCNAVDNDYFLTRPELKSKVNQLQPSGGTPIGRSIERAARILSPTKETVMVVVTDGDDTCKSTDPCEAARAAKASHPNLTINVVDVSGQGLGSCIAQNGGGRVLPANTAIEIQKAIKDATDQVMLPTACVKGP